ncbi:probable nuclear transport factor 2 [Drosophila bipectinata]|uniref:probable nuclear transport factor 2 n=1 Tax=Drosophila bipectinata TaxID=42026 RepID=UPI0007E7370F|nr:nuclear transport factor 2-like [Drosophila bipectinata]
MDSIFDFEEISSSFIDQYYGLFDDPDKREELSNFYNSSSSLLSFQGEQIPGPRISDKFYSLPNQRIKRIVRSMDAQPVGDDRILIHVHGVLQCEEDLPQNFSQVFLLQSGEHGYFIAHDIFRTQVI